MIGQWLLAWWLTMSDVVEWTLVIAAIVLTWVACEWIADNWRRKIVGPLLMRREYARMARERAAARRKATQSLVPGAANHDRTMARRYRTSAGNFHGTTRLTMVIEKGTNGEEDTD